MAQKKKKNTNLDQHERPTVINVNESRASSEAV